MISLLPFLFASAVFAGVLLTMNLVFWSARSRSLEQQETLGRRLGVMVHEGELLRAPAAPTPAWLGPVGRPLEGVLQRAGLDETPAAFVTRSALFAAVGAVCVTVIARSPLGLIGLVLGLLPLFFARRAAELRSSQVTAQLPDGLDLITRTLRAGHALSDALRISAAELPQPLGADLARVAEQHRLGRDLRECLLELVERNRGCFDVRLFVSAVLLQRETGGNLVEMLDSLAQTIRDRLVFQEKVRALTAEVRLSAAVLTGLPFLVAAVILAVQPDYLRPLLDTDLGRTMLAAGACSLIAGAWMMRLVSQVEAA